VIVGVWVIVGVEVIVGVWVTVGVRVCVGVAVDVKVGVTVGVCVEVGVDVAKMEKGPLQVASIGVHDTNNRSSNWDARRTATLFK
jgi:hypothetical protein